MARAVLVADIAYGYWNCRNCTAYWNNRSGIARRRTVGCGGARTTTAPTRLSGRASHECGGT